MHVQHGSSVVVTDGRKALFLRNNGDAEFPDLRLVRKWESPVAPDRELKSDAPGRVFSSRGGWARRSAYDEGNFHEQSEIEFAEHLAGALREHAREDSQSEMVLVAPPRTLGMLRKHFGRDVSDRIIAEIPKDLVKHSVRAIERLLTTYERPV